MRTRATRPGSIFVVTDGSTISARTMRNNLRRPRRSTTTVTRVPAPRLLTRSMLPPWASTMALHRLSPNPYPPVFLDREMSGR